MSNLRAIFNPIKSFFLWVKVKEKIYNILMCYWIIVFHTFYLYSIFYQICQPRHTLIALQEMTDAIAVFDIVYFCCKGHFNHSNYLPFLTTFDIFRKQSLRQDFRYEYAVHARVVLQCILR